MSHSLTDREISIMQNFTPLIQTNHIMDSHLNEIQINNFANLFKKPLVKKHKIEHNREKNDNSGLYFT